MGSDQRSPDGLVVVFMLGAPDVRSGTVGAHGSGLLFLRKKCSITTAAWSRPKYSMVDPASSSHTGNTHCRVCREDIRPGAKVCVQCSSPQNWTVYLFRWKEVLAAILALAPLYSAAISLRQLAIEDVPAPQIRAVLLSCEDTVRIAVAVANVGSAAGVVRTPLLEQLKDGNVSESYILDIDGDQPGGSRVLQVGETAELNLVRRVSGAEALPIRNPGELVLRVPYLGFDGESGSASAPFSECAGT